MKLASLKAGGRDGTLVVVSRDLSRCLAVPAIAATLQAALDDWAAVAPRLQDTFLQLDQGCVTGVPFAEHDCASPLPRAYQWVDGSAYVNHVELVRRARGADMPASFWTDPLMYQGGSDDFAGPTDPIVVGDEAFGIDFEAEVAVITGDVPMATTADEAMAHIRLIMLVNDLSLRHLIPHELGKGFGFYQSKPATSFSPVAVTPDELGPAWRNGRLHRPLRSSLNGVAFGCPDAGTDMVFSFADLIAHATRTRRLAAGSIVGSGTVSNKDADGGPGRPVADGGVGYSCIAEVRTIETIDGGKPMTSFMHFGDRVRIDMLDDAGASIFGAIDQIVAQQESRR
ncbi:MAG: fumarylacetoacetate hydrolase family protein [Janthinobacterium lividum]